LPHPLLLFFFFSSWLHDFLRFQNTTLTSVCFITQTHTSHCYN
jgi:hypothetical protein